MANHGDSHNMNPVFNSNKRTKLARARTETNSRQSLQNFDAHPSTFFGSVTRWGQEYEGKRATGFVMGAKMGPEREHNQAPFFVAETKPPYMDPRMGGAQYAGVFGHPAPNHAVSRLSPTCYARLLLIDTVESV